MQKIKDKSIVRKSIYYFYQNLLFSKLSNIKDLSHTNIKKLIIFRGFLEQLNIFQYFLNTVIMDVIFMFCMIMICKVRKRLALCFLFNKQNLKSCNTIQSYLIDLSWFMNTVIVYI